LKCNNFRLGGGWGGATGPTPKFPRLTLGLKEVCGTPGFLGALKNGERFFLIFLSPGLFLDRFVDRNFWVGSVCSWPKERAAFSA